MADWLNPQIGTQYVSFLDYLKARDEDAAKLFDNIGTNLPVGTIRWSSVNNRFEKFDGTNWVELTTQYSINVSSISGASLNDNGTTASDLWSAAKIISELNLKANTSLNNVSDSAILTKIKNVDGAGSGLDADLLDGLNSNTFVRNDVANSMTGSLNWANSQTGGWGGQTGAPAINVNDSDVAGLNALVFNDVAETATEGIVMPVVVSPTTLAHYATVNVGSDKELYLYPDASQTTKHKIYHTGNDSNLAKKDQANTFTTFPQRIQSDVNGVGFFDGVRQDGTRQYLLGATESTIPLDLRAYDIDGSTILGRIYFTSSGNIALAPPNGLQTYVYSSIYLYPTTDNAIEIYSQAGKGSYIRGRATDGASLGWYVGRGSPTSDTLYLTNYVAGANINFLTNGGVVYIDSNTAWHAGNDGLNSGLEPDVATSTRIGGMKARFDTTTKILYIRTDGADA